MHLDTASAQDWVSLGVGALGAISAYLASRDRLPLWARQWLKRIGSDQVLDSIQRAASIAELSPEQRRQQAVIYLQKLAVKQLGFPVPASIANLLVEHIYQQWKAAHK